MTDRDRLFAVVYEALPDRFGNRWRTSVSGCIANRLIAAGVTMPATACGSTAVVCGNKFVCDQPPHPGEPHQCTDSIGVMRWRDTPQGALVVSARTHPGSAGWPIHRAGECF